MTAALRLMTLQISNRKKSSPSSEVQLRSQNISLLFVSLPPHDQNVITVTFILDIHDPVSYCAAYYVNDCYAAHICYTEND